MPFDGTELSPVTRILIAARERIEDPENWCQRDLTRGKAMCAYAALSRASGTETEACRAAFDLLVKGMNAWSVSEWNDTHTHAEVLAAFDRAIALSMEA
jgi:hypothetical protein